jgi:hypothetical protein
MTRHVNGAALALGLTKGIPMSQPAPETSEFNPAAQLETEIQEAINLCGGDARAALRATLIANTFLQSEVERLAAIVSNGFARGRIRRRPGNATTAEKEAG